MHIQFASFLLLLCLLPGCAASLASEDQSGRISACCGFGVAVTRTLVSAPAVNVVEARCGGSGYITHGDGHRSPCPGCQDCKPKSRESQSRESPIPGLQDSVYVPPNAETPQPQAVGPPKSARSAPACSDCGSGRVGPVIGLFRRLRGG